MIAFHTCHAQVRKVSAVLGSLGLSSCMPQLGSAPECLEANGAIR